MRVLILKLVVTLLAMIGIHFPGGYVYKCNPGKTPLSAPSNCERIRL